jgi:glutathione S-transferase
MEIALYYAPNTCALAPYVTLTEAGADFEVRPLNFRKRQNFSPEYLKINPKHKVPTLVVDGKILPTTSPSINGSIEPSPTRRSCPPIRGMSCRRYRCMPGVPAAFTPI